MDKNTSKKIILILFSLSIFFICFVVLNSNLRKLRNEYFKKQTIETNNSRLASLIDSKTDNYFENKKLNLSLKKENEIEKTLNNWISIERKDSYNNELQYYSKDNVVINGDIIEITSKNDIKENKKYTSGLVESTSAYKYGYFEFTITISEGKGIFPAIWFLPNKGGAFPEIDLFEMIGSEPYIFYGVIHFKENNIQNSDYCAYEVAVKDQYTVSLQWYPQSITWYIDDKEIYTTTQGIPDEYMFILINQAIGGNWPGSPDDTTVFPNQFKILSSRIEPVFKKGRDS